MSNTSIGINTVVFNIFLKSDEQRLHQLYQENRVNFVYFATEYFDCKSEEAGDIFRQAFTILYLNIKNGIIPALDLSVEHYLMDIGKSLLKNKYVIRKEMEITERIDVSFLDFNIIEKHQNRQTKVVLAELFQNLGEPCRSILKLYYFCCFSMENIAEQIGSNNQATAKKKKYQCLEELKATIDNKTALKSALLNN